MMCSHRLQGEMERLQNCLRGSSRQKWSKLSNFLLFAQKVSSGMGASHPKFLGYFVNFVGNLLKIPKAFFFYSSIKTEEILFIYIYTFIYICIHIYI